ncbi:MAG: sigma-70 family RNA polymerase sigma factor [Sedimentisphaerales bacterium]|nr:sigma-70 family RNA polymerase sigma factor [Sedimentisphaerales bacterium]
MNSTDDYAKLIEKARHGDRQALQRVAEAAEVRLREYVLRLTLREDLTQDIVQETILEMFRVFEKLKKTDKFWPWLYGIAFNKVRSHYDKQRRHKAVSLSGLGADIADTESKNALADMVTQEFKQIVLQSMDQLQPAHRAVLSMRCYDRMAYSEIAGVIGCTEIGARALFYRAKKALARKLSAHGIGKASLLMALIVFGKMTTAGKAAAASLIVSAASLKVGPLAFLTAVATTRTAILTISVAAAITAGTATVLYTRPQSDTDIASPATLAILAGQQHAIDASADVQEQWYFYPEGPQGPVMTRLIAEVAKTGRPRCRRLENQHASYYCGDSTVTIRNFRTYNPDLSVRRLPTDTRDLTDFLFQVESVRGDMEYISDSRRGLLVILKRDSAAGNRIWRIDRHETTLDEQYFQCDWPENAVIDDQRDPMHKRGWTYFKISGQIAGRRVAGKGRIPFVYETAKSHFPWLDLDLGRGLKVVFIGAEAGVYGPNGEVIANFDPDDIGACLGKPWMGLHTIDAVRRDAAARKMRFQTDYEDKTDKARVVITGGRADLAYTIDMRRDVVERIEFNLHRDGNGDAKGEVRFSYLQEILPTDGEFAEPGYRGTARKKRDRLGVFWPAELADIIIGK